MSFPESFSIAESYAERAQAAASKSDRTRLRLLATVARLLDDVPFPQLRPSDVAEGAGLSRALLYHYFEDLAQLVTEIAEDFARRNLEGMRTIAPTAERYGYPEIVGYLSWILAVALRNRGVLRLMHTQTDQLPGARAALDRFIFDVSRRLGAYAEPPPGVAFGEDERLVAGYMIGGGFNSVMRELFVHPNSLLPRFATTESLFRLVQLAAALRHRQVHGRDPSALEVAQVAKAFDLQFFAPSLMASRVVVPSARPASMPRLRRMHDKQVRAMASRPVKAKTTSN